MDRSLNPDLKAERRKVIFSAIFSGILVLLTWIIWFLEIFLETDFAKFGLRPRSLQGLLGIITEPLLHGSVHHISANSVPLFLLLTGMLYFYRALGLKVTLLIWLLTGALVWGFARPSVHIGASGLIYGLAAFLASSGIIRNDTRLMAISLLTVFLYGSMVWGVFPLQPGVSWESHLMGALSGIFCAIWYRKQGPQKPVYFSEDVDEDDEAEIPDSTPGPVSHSGGTVRYIRYYYIINTEPEVKNDVGSEGEEKPSDT